MSLTATSILACGVLKESTVCYSQKDRHSSLRLIKGGHRAHRVLLWVSAWPIGGSFHLSLLKRLAYFGRTQVISRKNLKGSAHWRHKVHCLELLFIHINSSGFFSWWKRWMSKKKFDGTYPFCVPLPLTSLTAVSTSKSPSINVPFSVSVFCTSR